MRNRWLAFAITLTLTGLAAPAGAVRINSLAGMRLDRAFGTFGAHGDCTKGPTITVAPTGFTFIVGGKSLKPPAFEWAPAYNGDNDGSHPLPVWFFPFPRSKDDFGPLVMTLDAQSISFDKQDNVIAPLYATLLAGSPYTRCSMAPARSH